MKASKYRQLKKEAEERYSKAIEKAENERAGELAALEKVWKMMKPNYGKATLGTASASSKYGSLAETVRKSLELVPQRFTKKNVLTAMRQISTEVANKCNPNSLSGCLFRLKKEGVIAVVKNGQGSAPTEYQKIPETTKEDNKNTTTDNSDTG